MIRLAEAFMPQSTDAFMLLLAEGFKPQSAKAFIYGSVGQGI